MAHSSNQLPEDDENDGQNDGQNDDQLSITMKVEDKFNRKLIRKPMVQTQRRPISVYSMDKHLRLCSNLFAYHRLSNAARLMPALVRDQRTSHQFIINAALILFTQKLSDSSLLIKSMKKMSKYNVNKRQIMIEIILHLIRNNDINGAKHYIESNETLLKNNRFRKNKFIDTYLKCFICFVDYLEWKQSIEESNDNIIYHSNRLIAEKTKLSFKNIITETEDLILDYFVVILVEMYEYSQQFSEAFDILKVYIDNNPNHLNAYIYLYNFGVNHQDYSDPRSQLIALKNIQKYSPDNPLVLDLIETDGQTVDKFEVLINFIDHKPNDLKAWTQLKDLITSIKDNDIKKKINDLWKKFYEFYWIPFHLNSTKIKEINENVIELIGCQQKVIEFFYSSSHPFITGSNEKIDGYQTLFNY